MRAAALRGKSKFALLKNLDFLFNADTLNACEQGKKFFKKKKL